MELKDTMLNIRRKNGLTQEEFAERLFVTRQAVSRWERGETTPTVDTLKRIAEIFQIDANTLLGICQSCAMPLKGFDDFGTNDDKTANVDYCKYCFQNGKFTTDGTVEETVETNLQFLKEFNAENNANYTETEAREILKQYLPTLKRWKKAD